MKILTIVGARPQFVKAAIVSSYLRKSKQINEVLLHTGQHYDESMSRIFFDEMGLKVPKYNLDIHGGHHGAMTGDMLKEIEKVLLEEEPDCVMVYGDTNSTLAGALAAKKQHIKVIHIEAGLRSFNMKMPEEVNRILTDRISDYLFCTSDHAIKNLKNEGIGHAWQAEVINVGDVMYDAALHFSKMGAENPNKGHILLTLHRAENTDDEERLSYLIDLMNAVHQNHRVLCPMHPRTVKKLKEYGIAPQFDVIEPVGYNLMMQLILSSKLVLTDSGGLQKEAFYLGKYCVTLRSETEWVELLDVGANFLEPKDRTETLELIYQCFGKAFDPGTHKLYGNGEASQRILNELEKLAKTI